MTFISTPSIGLARTGRGGLPLPIMEMFWFFTVELKEKLSFLRFFAIFNQISWSPPQSWNSSIIWRLPPNWCFALALGVEISQDPSTLKQWGASVYLWKTFCLDRVVLWRSKWSMSFWLDNEVGFVEMAWSVDWGESTEQYCCHTSRKRRRLMRT